MKEFVTRVTVGVSVMVFVALLLRSLGVGEFSIGLWAGIFGQIAQTITGKSFEEKK